MMNLGSDAGVEPESANAYSTDSGGHMVVKIARIAAWLLVVAIVVMTLGPPTVRPVSGFNRSGTTLVTSAATRATKGGTLTVGHMARHMPSIDRFLRDAKEKGSTPDRGVDQLLITESTPEEYGWLLMATTGQFTFGDKAKESGILQTVIEEIAKACASSALMTRARRACSSAVSSSARTRDDEANRTAAVPRTAIRRLTRLSSADGHGRPTVSQRGRNGPVGLRFRDHDAIESRALEPQMPQISQIFQSLQN
jgi:hypothetical protein